MTLSIVSRPDPRNMIHASGNLSLPRSRFCLITQRYKGALCDETKMEDSNESSFEKRKSSLDLSFEKLAFFIFTTRKDFEKRQK